MNYHFTVLKSIFQIQLPLIFTVISVTSVTCMSVKLKLNVAKVLQLHLLSTSKALVRIISLCMLSIWRIYHKNKTSLWLHLMNTQETRFKSWLRFNLCIGTIFQQRLDAEKNPPAIEMLLLGFSGFTPRTRIHCTFIRRHCNHIHETYTLKIIL